MAQSPTTPAESSPQGDPGRSVLERIVTWLRGWSDENPEGLARLMLWASEGPNYDLEEPGLLALGRSFLFGVAPPNWASLRVGVNLRAAKLIRETGLCLVWVPDGTVIEALVRATSKAHRDRVLVEESASILASVEDRLGEVTHPELQEQRMAAIEALETLRSGQFGSSQAHSATIISGLLEHHYGFDFTSARRAFEKDSTDSQGLWSLRRTLVQEALRHAIVTSKRRPAESGFNRHLSCHGTELSHFTEPHSLEALMLLAGALRELNEIYRVAEFGFGPSPRLEEYATEHLVGSPAAGAVDQSRVPTRSS